MRSQTEGEFMTNNEKDYVVFIVKKDNQASIQDYAQIPGARVSFAWKLNPKKANPGDRVSFHESWTADSFDQGEIITKFAVGDRWAVVYQPDQLVLKGEVLPHVKHSQEKGYFTESEIRGDVVFLNPPYQDTSWGNPEWSEGRKTGVRYRYTGKPGSYRIIDPTAIQLLAELGVKGARGPRVVNGVVIATCGTTNLLEIERNGCWECASGNDNARAGMTMVVLPTKDAQAQYPHLSGIVFELADDCRRVDNQPVKQAV
jgi:hypothetical protein